MAPTTIEYADEVSNPLYVTETSTGKRGTHCEMPDPCGTCANCWAAILNGRGNAHNKRFGTGLAYDRKNRHLVEWHRHDEEMARLHRLDRRFPTSKKFPNNPLIVFTNDTYDLFQPSISDEMRDWVFDNYDQIKNLRLLIQSTYAANMARYLERRYTKGMPEQYTVGMSAGDQRFLDKNLGYLLHVPAACRYLIFEPLLEQVDLLRDGGGHPRSCSSNLADFIHLVIIGGESGNDARTCDARWIRSLASQAAGAGCSVLIKQVGAHARDGAEFLDTWPAGTKFGKPASSKTLLPELSVRVLLSRRGGDLNAWPPDLRVREFPPFNRGGRA